LQNFCVVTYQVRGVTHGSVIVTWKDNVTCYCHY